MKTMPMKLLAVASLLLSFAPTPATADELSAREDLIPQEILDCSSIRRNSERLACYDRAIGAIRSGAPMSEGAATESNFGLVTSAAALPPAPKDGTSESRGDVDSIKTSVKGFGRSESGARVIHLENGQSWAQLSSGETLLRVGDPVTINRAALGSFQMLVPSGRSAKVRRIG